MNIRFIRAIRTKAMTRADKASFGNLLSPNIWLLPVIAFSLILITFRRFIGGWVVATGDLETYFFPYWVVVIRSFRSGVFPLWNPYLFTGVPLLANSQVGVFYPLNWPFWSLAGSTLKGIVSALHASILFHVCLAWLNMYSLGRKMHLGAGAASLAGLVYACCGFIGIHIEHLNQLQALAWMPLVLLPTTKKIHNIPVPHPVALVAMAMILLAGHTQMAFITGIALLMWRISEVSIAGLHQIKYNAQKSERIRRAFYRIYLNLKGWLIYLSLYIVAVLIAAAQLLPTLELVTLSPRQGGLDWREAVSFSLQPWDFAGTFLPPYLAAPIFPESVAYVGSLGLVLMGIGVWGIYRKRQSQYLPIVILAISGVVLALGGYNPIYLLGVRIGLPGFRHFRAPVRFLAYYVLAASLLAGLGLDYLRARIAISQVMVKYRIPLVICVIALTAVSGDLMICAKWLPHADATTPRAYTDLRPATAHLISISNQDKQAGLVPGRFLSISQMLFEVGDKAEVEGIYESVLSPDALWLYLISEKQREVLTPNLPLAFGVFAADGYDGGLLPMAPYIEFTRLFLDQGTQDGRLRENLTAIPDRRWLKLMDVHYLITDKVSDVWVDDILYDRQFFWTLSPAETLNLAWLPDAYKANGIGLLYVGREGQVTVELDDGRILNFELPGAAEYDPYRIRWENSATVSALSITTRTNSLTLNGLSLINEVTGSFYPLTLSDTYRLTHSGDVKIYEDVFPSSRAYVVWACETTKTDSTALAMMADPSFDPLTSVVLDSTETDVCNSPRRVTPDTNDLGEAVVRVLDYQDSEVTMDVVMQAPGFLILSDAWYPGWHARLTNADAADSSFIAPVLRGNLMFRVIPVPAGHWTIGMTYRSNYLIAGILLSAVGLITLTLYCRVYNTK